MSFEANLLDEYSDVHADHCGEFTLKCHANLAFNVSPSGLCSLQVSAPAAHAAGRDVPPSGLFWLHDTRWSFGT